MIDFIFVESLILNQPVFSYPSIISVKNKRVSDMWSLSGFNKRVVVGCTYKQEFRFDVVNVFLFKDIYKFVMVYQNRGNWINVVMVTTEPVFQVLNRFIFYYSPLFNLVTSINSDFEWRMKIAQDDNYIIMSWWSGRTSVGRDVTIT